MELFLRSTSRGRVPYSCLELLEERIVLDGDVTWDSSPDPDGVWHGTDTDGWDHYWVDDNGTILYFQYDDSGQWWQAVNGDHEDPDWKPFGDPGTSSDFIYDGRWHENSDGTWFHFDEGRYGYWWSDFGGNETYFAYDYRTGEWWQDVNGYYETGGWQTFGSDGASSLFVYDGEWYHTASGLWYRYDGFWNESYLWHEDTAGTETYLAYEHDSGQWWEDSNGYFESGGWGTVGSAGAEAPFMLGDAWTFSYDDVNDYAEWTNGTDDYRYDIGSGERLWYDRVDDAAWEAFQAWFDDNGTQVFNDWDLTYYDDSLGFYDFVDIHTGETGVTLNGIDYYEVFMTDLGVTEYDAQFRNEIIYGTAGNDSIAAGGNEYRYYVFGGSGTDSIRGGELNDVLYGYVPHASLPDDSAVALWMDAGELDAIADAGHVDNGSDYEYIYANGGDDVIFGGPGNNYMIGDSLNDAGYGNDLIFGGTATDIAVGDSYYGDGYGDDVIYGYSGWNLFLGDSQWGTGYGNDILYGGPDSDYLYGDCEMGAGYGNDILYGYDGYNWLAGDSEFNNGYGDDVIFGGANVDIIHGDSMFAAGYGNDLIYGYAGDDVLAGDSMGLIMAGDSQVYGQNWDEHPVWGPTYQDNPDLLLIATGEGHGNDRIFGGEGNDELWGDSVRGDGDGHDVLYGGDGNDELYGDTMHGVGSGSDYLYGDADDDELYGDSVNSDGSGDDTLFGGTGSNVLYGDTVAGTQSGADSFYRWFGSGDTFPDFDPGSDTMTTL